MMELKGVEKLDHIIEQFFFELGYDDIECNLGTDFCYYEGTNEIEYSLFAMENADEGFKRFLMNTYEEIPKCSLFVISILHELGHHLTLDNFTEEEKKTFRFDKLFLEHKIIKTDEEAIELQIAYCNLEEEKAATDKAIEILKSNYDFIHIYEKKIFEGILDFCKKNNITA